MSEIVVIQSSGKLMYNNKVIMANGRYFGLYCIFTLFFLCPSGILGYKTYYMKYYCGGTLDLSSKKEDYGLINYSPYSGYPANEDCRMAVQAPPGKGMTMRINTLDIYRSWYTCKDWLKVYTDNGQRQLGDDLCGYYPPSYSFLFPRGHMTLHFHTDSSGSSTRKGFQLVFTSYSKDPCNTTSEFECSELANLRERRCIPRHLTCDRLDNCGDYSDEESAGCPPRSLSVGEVIGIVLGTLGLIMIICCCLCFCIQAGAGRKPSSRRSRHSRASPNPRNSANERTRDTTLSMPEPPPPYTVCETEPQPPVSPSGVSNMAFTSDPPPYSPPTYSQLSDGSGGQTILTAPFIRPSVQASVSYEPNGTSSTASSVVNTGGPTLTATSVNERESRQNGGSDPKEGLGDLDDQAATWSSVGRLNKSEQQAPPAGNVTNQTQQEASAPVVSTAGQPESGQQATPTGNATNQTPVKPAVSAASQEDSGQQAPSTCNVTNQTHHGLTSSDISPGRQGESDQQALSANKLMANQSGQRHAPSVCTSGQRESDERAPSQSVSNKAKSPHSSCGQNGSAKQTVDSNL